MKLKAFLGFAFSVAIALPAANADADLEMCFSKSGNEWNCCHLQPADILLNDQDRFSVAEYNKCSGNRKETGIGFGVALSQGNFSGALGNWLNLWTTDCYGKLSENAKRRFALERMEKENWCNAEEYLQQVVVPDADETSKKFPGALEASKKEAATD